MTCSTFRLNPKPFSFIGEAIDHLNTYESEAFFRNKENKASFSTLINVLNFIYHLKLIFESADLLPKL
jgi:hypothetical protein